MKYFKNTLSIRPNLFDFVFKIRAKTSFFVVNSDKNEIK